MNIIFVLIDSVNRHQLDAYGGPQGVTPNLARFAQRAVRFDNHFVGSLPCMPARREMFTGRKEFLWRPWGHLEPFDTVLPQVAKLNGHKTMMVTDHYHYWEENANGYMESFSGLEMIRGYENDNWNVDPVEKLPVWAEAINRYRPGWGTRYYRNVRDFRSEEDFFSAKVFARGADWIRTNYGHEPFFLQVEAFGAHEPFHLPEPYRSMWTKHLSPDFNFWPPYQDSRAMAKFFASTTKEELDFIRGQYLGKLTMLDHWFGAILDQLDSLEAWSDTMVIVTTDHGHDLGERQAFGKQFPHYGSHAQIPLLIWHPKLPNNLRGGSISGITSTVDLNPTVVEALGAKDYQAPHGRSLWPLLNGTQRSFRDAVLYGTYGQGVGCSDSEITLLQGFDNTSNPLFLYSTRMPGIPKDAHDRRIFTEGVEMGPFIPGVDVPVWKLPWRAGKFVGSATTSSSILYRRADPMFNEKNILATDRRLLQQAQSLMRDMMADEGTPPEQYARIGLDN